MAEKKAGDCVDLGWGPRLGGVRARVGFLREQLRRSPDDDFVARLHALRNDIAVLEGFAAVNLGSDERAGLFIDIAPVFSVADDRGLRGNQYARLRSADRCPRDDSFSFSELAGAQYRKETASGDGDIRGRGPNQAQLPTLAARGRTQARCAERSWNVAARQGPQGESHSNQLRAAVGQGLQQA